MIRDLLASLGRGPDRAVAAAPSTSSARALAILIIDDHADDVHAMCLALAGDEYHVERADTARSAIRKLSTRHPDLILLDSRVPAADGTQLARQLLADEELASIPIVEITEGFATAELVAGLQRDCKPGGRYDGRIRKPDMRTPLDACRFAGHLRGFLESSRQGAPHPGAESLLPAGVDVDRRKDAATVLDAIDQGLPDSQFAPATRICLHRLAGVVAGLQHYELGDYLQRAERLSNARTVRGRSRFQSMIRICLDLVDRDPDVNGDLAKLRLGYLDHLRANLDGLEHALKNGDFAALSNAGHNLKGTGAAYGFAEITDMGSSLEAAANDGDPAAIETLLDRIDAYIGIVRPSAGRA